MAKTAKELLTYIVDECAPHMTGKTLLIAVVDEVGIFSTVRVAKVLEEAEPGHASNAIIILAQTYYAHYIEPLMQNEKFVMTAPGKSEPLQ